MTVEGAVYAAVHDLLTPEDDPARDDECPGCRSIARVATEAALREVAVIRSKRTKRAADECACRTSQCEHS